MEIGNRERGTVNRNGLQERTLVKEYIGFLNRIWYNLVLRQLKRKIGTISSQLKQKITELPVKVIEDLGEALLEFSTEEDLLAWLRLGRRCSKI